MADRPEPFDLVRLGVEAMGTRFEIVLPVDSPAHRSGILAAGEEAIAEIREAHARLTGFEPSSFVSFLNRHAPERPVVCDDQIFRLLQACRHVWRGSKGAFDPTVAALMRASGFRGASRSSEALAAARASTGFQYVELDEAAQTVRFSRPGVALDLGAIAKGWALDRSGHGLREAGVVSAILHGGASSVLVIGAPPRSGPPSSSDPDNGAWAVALAGHSLGVEPRDAPRALLRDFALGVSAPHGRVVADDAGASHGHVLDPRSGLSAAGPALTAVACSSAALADAWSTALLVDPDLASSPDLPPCSESAIATRIPEGGLGWRFSGPGRVIRPPQPGR